MQEKEKLRSERKLRMVTRAEDGVSIEFAPAGVYGFTYSPATEGTPLFSLSSFQIFEVHKLSGEDVHLIGYLSEADAKSFATAKDSAELKLYPEPYGEAKTMVSVPQKRILRAKPASRDNGNFIAFVCIPEPD